MPTSRRKTNRGVEAPRPTLVELDGLTPGDAESLVAREHHEGEHFDGGDLTEYDLEGASFTECLFSGVTLTAARLRAARFVESVFVDSFAPELKAARTTWRDVRLERPRWGSAELFDAELESVTVQGGKIDYLNLRSSTLADVVFEGVVVTELDLGDVTANRVAFVDCRIGTLDVTRARLSSVDLRSSMFDGVNGLGGLRGAVVDYDQLMMLAPALAAEIGLVVE